MCVCVRVVWARLWKCIKKCFGCLIYGQSKRPGVSTTSLVPRDIRASEWFVQVQSIRKEDIPWRFRWEQRFSSL